VRSGHDKKKDIPTLISQKEKPSMKYRHIIIALAVFAAANFGPAYGQTTEGQSVGVAIMLHK